LNARRAAALMSMSKEHAVSDIVRNVDSHGKRSGDRGKHAPARESPAGALQPREDPLDKDAGRRAQIEAANEQQESPGQPAGGE
jgi:hypothetical protein